MLAVLGLQLFGCAERGPDAVALRVAALFREPQALALQPQTCCSESLSS